MKDLPSKVEMSDCEIPKVIDVDSISVNESRNLNKPYSSDCSIDNSTIFSSDLDYILNSKIESFENKNTFIDNPQFIHLKSESKVDLNVSIPPDLNSGILEKSRAFCENSIDFI